MNRASTAISQCELPGRRLAVEEQLPALGALLSGQGIHALAERRRRHSHDADGDHLVVELNGETTLDIHDARFSEGHLRLQYQQFPIAFRNIKIRSLP
jgi:hypothetical protein